jgi:hypothetical protein
MARSDQQDKRPQLGWEEVVGFLDTPSNFLWLAGSLVGGWLLTLAMFKAEAVNDAFQALAFLVGGFWVLYQFVLRRSFESGLEIEVAVTTSSASSPERVVVFIDVRLKNIGNRRITAPPNLADVQIDDFEHSVKYPGDLQIARIQPEHGEAFAGWFKGLETGILSLAPGVPAVRVHARQRHRFLHGARRIVRSGKRVRPF